MLELKWEKLDSKQISVECAEYLIDSIDMINDQIGAHVDNSKPD
jgi:hypothetical protein